MATKSKTKTTPPHSYFTAADGRRFFAIIERGSLLVTHFPNGRTGADVEVRDHRRLPRQIGTAIREWAAAQAA